MSIKTTKQYFNCNFVQIVTVIAVSISILSSCSENSHIKAETNQEMSCPSANSSLPSFTESGNDTIWYEVDSMPEFPGGNQALLNYIAVNTKYPAEAKANGVEGKVIVSFSVSEAKEIENVKIVQGVDPEIDAEALRVVQSLPDFEKAAIKDGREVPVWFMVPISFKLK